MNADLSFEEYFEATIESLWAAIATSAALAEWLMPNDFEPRVGHRFTLRCEGYGHGRIESEVLECSPPNRLVFSWIDAVDGEPMRVEIDLRSQGSGTLLSLRHTGTTDPRNVGSLENGWSGKFDNLRRYFHATAPKERSRPAPTRRDVMASEQESTKDHQVVSREAWMKARKELLSKEKEFTKSRDKLSQQRRELPWVKVDKEYVFEGSGGKQTLAQLFEDRSQLIVYHFMFAPEWEEGCPHCSFWADNFNGIPIHLKHRDVSMVAVSRAPIKKLQAFEKRMGWSFKWVSSFESDFNYDYHASFTKEEVESGTAFHNYHPGKVPLADMVGVSTFYKDERGSVFHTYSCYSRGVDILNGAYNYLDLVAKGRDEDGLDFTQAWVRYHDKYE